MAAFSSAWLSRGRPRNRHPVLGQANGRRPLHGYAIAKRIVAMHQNTVRSMGPATLYGSIQKLMDLGLLEENGVLETDSRRKTYKLTQAGQSVFAEQFNQRQRFLDSARSSAPEGLASGGAR